jgi:hypothetical protein
MSDAELETTYLGDSVYISLDHETGGFVLFLNNGERDFGSGTLLRKQPLYMESRVALSLVYYLNAHGVTRKVV